MRLFLAPMEGVTDFHVRQLLTEVGGFDFCVSEFLRITHQLLPNHVFYKISPELKARGRTRSGVPVLFQLLGGDPNCLAENAAKAIDLGAPGIDLNFGCPAKTVNRHDGGATLLKYPDRLFRLVETVRKAIPSRYSVSAKIRLGFDDTDNFLVNTKAIEAAGANWLTIHARTKAQGYRPPAHWEWIGLAKEQLKIPIVANGDIWSLETFSECQKQTSCEDFMLGRGAFAQPDLGRLIHAHKQQKSLAPLQWPEICSLLEKHSHMAATLVSEHFALQRGKQWLKHLGRNYIEAQQLFSKIRTAESLDTFIESLQPTKLSNKQVQFANLNSTA